MPKSYASLEIIAESESEDVDEVQRKVLEWVRESADKLTKENVKVIQTDLPGGFNSRTLKTGDRVVAVVDGKQEVGTVVSLLFIGKNGPQAFVRLDNGALRSLTVDNITPFRESSE